MRGNASWQAKRLPALMDEQVLPRAAVCRDHRVSHRTIWNLTYRESPLVHQRNNSARHKPVCFNLAEEEIAHTGLIYYVPETETIEEVERNFHRRATPLPNQFKKGQLAAMSIWHLQKKKKKSFVCWTNRKGCWGFSEEATWVYQVIWKCGPGGTFVQNSR